MRSYRLKLLIAIQNSDGFATRNEIMMPEVFASMDDALEFAFKDIDEKIHRGKYFRSQVYGFDLVHYHNVASYNTYIAYRVVIQHINQSLLSKDFVALTYI